MGNKNKNYNRKVRKPTEKILFTDRSGKEKEMIVYSGTYEQYEKAKRKLYETMKNCKSCFKGSKVFVGGIKKWQIK